MLIPSIDLQGGRIVQLVQGETLAVETSDIDAWVRRFSGYASVQLIDLDAARGEGTNEDLMRTICAQLPCRVGGGIRTLERARQILNAGATAVILGSAFFGERGVNVEAASNFAAALGPERLIAAVDSRGGRVVIHGWRTQLEITPVAAVQQLGDYCGEFLFTVVDREGLMGGTDFEAIESVRAATSRRVTAAGGITTHEEIDRLHAIGVDAVVGMAIYTGRMRLPDDGRPRG